MKRKAISTTILALACLGITVSGHAATNNDRFYVAQISPSVTTTTAPQAYFLTITNDIVSGPSHFIRQIKVTVPAAFTLVNIPGTTSPVTLPPLWMVQSITPAANLPGPHVITFVTINSNDQSMTSGKSATFVINASVPGGSTSCTSSQFHQWLLDVNQAIGGGNGNTYLPRAGSPYPPKVEVTSATCKTATLLNLAISPSAISTTGNQTVTLTATLTSSLDNSPIGNEPITFTLGGQNVIPCAGGTPATNASGVATCSFVPQSLTGAPFPLAAGNYDAIAHFAGDTAPTPDWGASDSQAKQLTVNATGTGVTVADAEGPFGGSVSLVATLTSGGSGIGGKTVTFLMNGVSVGTAVTDGSGIATKTNVSLEGIAAGSHPGYIGVSFAADSTYSGATGSATLKVTTISGTIDLTDLTKTYNGSAQYPTVTTNPSGLGVLWTNAPQTNAGSYVVTATIQDNNYTGSDTDTFVIQPKNLTATITAASKSYNGSNAAQITNCTLSGVIPADVPNVTCNTSDAAFASSEAGTWTVTANVSLTGSASANYTVTSPVTTTASIIKANQTALTLIASSPLTFNQSQTLSTTGGTGNGAVTFSLVSGPCTLVGAQLTANSGTGACIVKATKAGGNNYEDVTSPEVTVTLQKANQDALTVTGPGSITYGTTGTATYSGGSGTGAVTFSAGASTGCSVSGTTVSVSDASGSCSLTATKAGDNNYNSATSAPFNVTLNKASQAALTVTGPESITYGSTGEATATGGTGTGALSFSAGASTGCSVSGTTITVTNASGNCVLTATKAADNNYNATTSAPFTVTLNKANQAALTVTAPSSLTYGNTGTATASGGSGTGTVSFSAAGSTGCSVSGTTVSVSNASGTCTLTATKAGDDNYNATTSAPFQVTLNKANQSTLSVTAPASVTYGTTGTATTSGGNGTGAVSFDATGSTGCSVSGTTVSVSNASGTCTLTATKAGDDNYNATSSAPYNVTLNKATAIVNLSNLSLPYNGQAQFPTASTTPGGLTIVWTGAPQTNPGTYDVTAAVNDLNYAGQASGKFIITKLSQTITFTSITVEAKATSEGPVTFTNDSPAICQLVSNGLKPGTTDTYTATLTLLSGNWTDCKARANQSGTANYEAAPQATALLGTLGL
jgi:MBG domain-containing protein